MELTEHDEKILGEIDEKIWSQINKSGCEATYPNLKLGIISAIAPMCFKNIDELIEAADKVFKYCNKWEKED